MAVYKRPGSPFYWYDFTVKGHRVRGSTETASREDAELIEATKRRDALLGKILDQKPRSTLDAAFGRFWLEHGYRLRAAKTMQYRMGALKKALPMSAFLDELTDSAIATYCAKRRAQVSDSTVNRELTTLRTILRMAGDRWGFEVPKINWGAHWNAEPDPIARYITAEQARKLIDAANPWLRAPLEFSLMTGVRLKNCMTLDWSQIVDLGKPTAHILFRVKSKKADGKAHVVYINEAVRVLLANQDPKDKGPVFTRKGKAMKDWRGAWEGTQERAGMSGIRWHDLRHSFASWAVQSGAPMDVVQKALGHQNITTTMRYANRAPSAQIAALDAVAAHLRHSDSASQAATPDNTTKIA